MRYLWLVALFFSSASWAADCTQVISSLESHKKELVADLTIAKKYFMESTDPSVVGTFEERTARLNERTQQKLGYFQAQRTSEYGNIVCKFRKEKTCTNGTHKLKTCGEQLVVPSEYSIISVDKTANGDLKKYSQSGNTFDFAAGLSSPGKATAYVSVQARYSAQYIQEQVTKDSEQVKIAINNAGIPTIAPSPVAP
ncbi:MULTISPECIES: hypothetical protein [unclassified Pseudomonas]|uniref:hypothetical protein n=1 Tax=unclassified Pseudomonas TaxID=196821 RepID=UPI001C46D367|nr:MULTISPECIES: hypothetical protein [unclassified Pseudomonas]MBV7527149.1 hypothetical protein [Pseudomonas sp. PDM29]